MTDRFAKIADRMNALVFTDSAELRYDTLADALWWSDERPDFADSEDHWSLQRMFRYRTTLILGDPDPDCEADWTSAQQQFPDWPGFHPSRCTPNDALVAFFHQHHQAATNAFENIPD